MKKKILFCLMLSISFLCCSEQGFYKAINGINAGLQVTNDLMDAYDRVKQEVNSYTNNRGASFIDMSEEVNTGDVLTGQEKEDFLSGFELAGYGDKNCSIYLCKDDTTQPCNPKESACNCKCAYK